MPPGFDPNRLVLTTPAVPVIQDVVPTTLALSASGTALYSVAAGKQKPSELLWVARDGTTEPVDSTLAGRV